MTITTGNTKAKRPRQLRMSDSLWERLEKASKEYADRTEETTVSGLIRKFCLEGLVRLEREAKRS